MITWAELFENAVVALQSETPDTNFYYPDMIALKNYSLQAKQLIFGSCKAWVFGGMSSWNDLGFDEKKEQEKYDKLTEKLYEAVLVALLAGINTY